MLQPVIDRRNKDAVMGLGEHLEELRSRLIRALLGLLPLLAVALYFADKLLEIMLAPLLRTLRELGQPENLQNTGVMEGFGTYIKLSLIVTVVVGIPWIIYQLWKFIAPGLYSHERRFAYVLAPLSTILTILGLLTLYYIMLPVALKYLVNFGATLVPPVVATAPLAEGTVLPKLLPMLAADPPSPEVGQMWINTELHAIRVAFASASGTGIEIRGTALVQPNVIAQQYRVQEYVDLFYGLSIAFVLAFQLPVVVLLLGWAGLVNGTWLRQYWRHALVFCLVAAAIITPTPDPLSMLTLAVPMYMLYELGIVLLWLLPASRVIGKKPEVSDDPTAGEG